MTTTNKSLAQPANNSSNWDTPLNANFGNIDAALGTVQAFNLGSVSGTVSVSGTSYAGSYPGSTASYVPLIFSLTGAPSGNVTLQIPSGVGGEWIVRNGTTGSYSVTISSAGGGASVVIPQSQTRSIFSDGTNISFSDTQTTVAGSNGQVIYNSGGSLTGSSSLTFDGTTMTAPALAASTNVAAGGNLTAGGAVSATTTVTAGTGFVFPDSTTQITAYGGAVPGAFSGLKISAASSTVAVTYNYVSLLSTTNFKTVSAGSLSISTAASGANGLDTGTIAANTWYAVYVIYNSTTATAAGLISLSGTSPTLPSGYTYKARVGWVRYGSSALVSTIQYGDRAQYVATSSGFPVISTGPVTQWTAAATGSYVPSTASQIYVSIYSANANIVSGISANNSPTNNYDGIFQMSNGTGTYSKIPVFVVLESSNIYWFTNAGSLYCEGWIDNL
jgi:hypothetical protein